LNKIKGIGLDGKGVQSSPLMFGLSFVGSISRIKSCKNAVAGGGVPLSPEKID